MKRDRIAQSFRRGLSSYSRAAQVQKDGTARLLDIYDLVSTRRAFPHALEFGCGTGFLTRALLSRFQISDLTLNDLLPEAEPRVADVLGQVSESRFLPGPVEELDVPQGLDLIASAATVQWVEDQARLLEKLTDALAEDGWLLLSGFGPSHFAELQSLGLSRFGDSFRDPEGWRAILPANLTPITVQVETHVLQLKTPHSVLMHLRETGVNGAVGQQWTRARLRTFEEDYLARFGSDRGVSLTYQPVYLIARKQSPRA